MSDGGFIRAGDGHVVVQLRLTPKGGSDRIDGLGELADGRKVMLARVRAAPDKGAANAALEALLAKAVGVPRSAVSLISGHTARLKSVRIDGEVADLVARLGRLTG
ncbi:DUF167 family protein [Kaistia defluvii]|uniref:DUF167 family protein n=1 Tax=Kaistia defluvii TaxID=410841 RepID=UPI002254234A|nr:DUF167 family protein [Kaistia defluvii]MCX5520867.1 DUF167 family protein [Kaistia defluvii]